MRVSALIVATLASLGAACAPAREIQLENAFPHLVFDKPLYLGAAPGDRSEHGRLYLLEQDGRVHVFENRPGVKQTTLALDLGARVRRENWEEGLLGMAFHPDFGKNRQVFLCYSAGSPRRNVYSRWRFDESGTKIDEGSEEVFLEVEQPFGNHNGGGLEFGPDGFLYISLGDGGSAGDPHDNGQRLETLLGSILRIDVDRKDPGLRYAIPKDNPFVGREDARPEIWAYGLRNVWRFSFDPETGALWAGDVGQSAREEIDLIEKGGNHGWRVREGKQPYAPDPSRPGPFVEPVVDHGRREAISITGGHVYRGRSIPSLAGAYVYGDFGTGWIWKLRYDREKEVIVEHERIAKSEAIASFGVDREGELFVCSFDGRVYRLVLRADPPVRP